MIVRIFSKHQTLDERNESYVDIKGSDYVIGSAILQVMRKDDARGTLYIPLANIGAFLVLSEAEYDKLKQTERNEAHL